MATIGRIDIAMGVETAKFQQDLNKAANALGHFEAKTTGQMAGARGPIESLTGAVGTLGQGFAALGMAAGVGLGLRSVIGTAIQTEKSIAGLSKATDLYGEDLGGLKGDLQQLSLTLKGVPLEDLYGIATSGAKLGVARSELVGFTEGIAKLSATMTEIPADQLSDQMGKIGAVFKLGFGRDLQGVGSAIAKVADSGVSAQKDILEVTQRLSGTAAASKITAAETVALAGALLDTGTQAELAATTLQRLIMSLNTVEGQEGFAKTLGISAEDFAAKVRENPVKALQEWLVALKGMDAQAQQSAIAGLGIDAIKASGEIMKLAQQTDSLGKYLGLAAHEFKSLDQLNKSYAITAAGTGPALEQAKNGFKILADDIGSAFMPILQGASGIFVDMLPTIRSGIGGLIMIVEGGMRLVRLAGSGLIMGVAGALSGLVKIIGSLGGLVPNMLKSISDPLDAFTEELQAKAMADKDALTKLGKDSMLGRNNPWSDPGTPQAPAPAGDGAAAKHAADVAKAGAASSKTADDVAKLNEKLQEQVATFGMSSSAAEIHKLRMAGASAAELANAEALSKQLEALEANKKAQDEAARESKRVADEISGITSKLQEQVDTFGKSGAQLDVYRLKQLGASDAVIAHAQALADQRDALEKSKKAQDDLAAKAKDTYEATRTPMEKATEEAAKLKEMLSKGLIDKDTFERAGSKLASDAFKTSGNEYHENGALELGSAEARTAVLKFRGMGGDGDGIRDVARINREQLAEQRQGNGLFRQLLAAATKPGEPPVL